jgi:RimJ/RimL family protein N-acetyltransferase
MNNSAIGFDGNHAILGETLHVNFRVLTPDDANAVSRLLLEGSTEYMRFFHPFAFDSSTVRLQLERAKKDVFFGLEVGSCSEGELAGFYMMRGLDEGYPNPMYGVFVSPTFCCKGLARLTLSHAICFCKLNHYERILLKVDPNNVRAKKLYESCGFHFLRNESASREIVLYREINWDACQTASTHDAQMS